AAGVRRGIQRVDRGGGGGALRSQRHLRRKWGRAAAARSVGWRRHVQVDGQQIPAVIVDPHDPNRVFAAVLGHPYGPNAERGVFRSTDGGKTWEKVLYKDENTGAFDVAFDPSNPGTVFATLW